MNPHRRVEYADVVTAARHFDEPDTVPAVQDIDWSLDNLRRIMDRHDIKHALAYSLQGKLYDFVSGNDETLDAAELDERIVPVATIDPRRHFGCLTEVERCMDLGIRLFRFFPDAQRWSVNSLSFLRLCDEMVGQSVVLMLPSGPCGRQSHLAGIMEDRGISAIFTGTTFQAISEAMSIGGSSNIYWETSAMHSVEAIASMISEVGIDRLLFGSNSPEYAFEAPRNLVSQTGIDPSEMVRIMAGNAASLLGLDIT